jgi:hypothetical protein
MRTTYSETIQVQGQTTTTDRRRRYAVVAVRPQPIKTEQGMFVAFARVEKRTDSEETAIKAAALARTSAGLGVEIVVVDRSLELDAALWDSQPVMGR